MCVEGPAATAEKTVNMDDYLQGLRLDLLTAGRFGTQLPTMNGNDLAPIMGVLTRRSQCECMFSTKTFNVCVGSLQKQINRAHNLCVQER